MPDQTTPEPIALDTRPKCFAHPVMAGMKPESFLIRTGGDTLGAAQKVVDHFHAYRSGAFLGRFPDLAGCAVALLAAEEAELAGRSASRAARR